MPEVPGALGDGDAEDTSAGLAEGLGRGRAAGSELRAGDQHQYGAEDEQDYSGNRPSVHWALPSSSDSSPRIAARRAKVNPQGTAGSRISGDQVRF